MRPLSARCSRAGCAGQERHLRRHGLHHRQARSLVRKWFSLIETFVDVKTTDGYSLRVFCIGFTKRRMDQANALATRSRPDPPDPQEDERHHLSRVLFLRPQECVLKFIPEVIGKEIEKVCQGIYPLQNVYIRKVKILKSPKFDVTKLMEVHGDYSGEEVGAKVDAPPRRRRRRRLNNLRCHVLTSKQ